jgi:hypothetical protein
MEDTPDERLEDQLRHHPHFDLEFREGIAHSSDSVPHKSNAACRLPKNQCY